MKEIALISCGVARSVQICLWQNQNLRFYVTAALHSNHLAFRLAYVKITDPETKAFTAELIQSSPAHTFRSNRVAVWIDFQLQFALRVHIQCLFDIGVEGSGWTQG
jgi:hypothetical protein